MFSVKKSLIGILAMVGATMLNAQDEYKVAFVSDVHFHDVYGDFKGDFKGLKSEVTGKYATIRTMDSQMNSTRLFNENYFAFIAVLDDLVKKDIKYIVLPGDFSDDGQEVHIEGLKKIMDNYTKKHGIKFYITFGNHDPVMPMTVDKGKMDYLGENGKEQPIFSKNSKIKEKDGMNPVIFSEVVKEQGYEDIMKQINSFGLVPEKSDIYWETPFSKYSYEQYSFEKALEDSSSKNRKYEISYEGSGDKLGNEKFEIVDGSYLVEPTKGLWLLAIDSNVYVPTEDGKGFTSASNAGYNRVLTHKKHLINWVEKVAKTAEEKGKTLVTFSHYPMVDFYNGASEEVESIFGTGKFELRRVPTDEVAKTFADAGIKLHFGGHMHFNDTGVKKNENGNFLVNVQVPSIAAYVPAYKLLSIDNKKGEALIQTVRIDEVPRFNELFEHYEKEYVQLEKSGAKNIWNKDILKSKSYKEFANWHIQELVRLRFLPKDWPEDIKENIIPMSGKDMFNLLAVGNEKSAEKILKENGVKVSDLEKWNGTDLVTDLYRFRNAGNLALSDVSTQRVKEYKVIYEISLNNKTEENKVTDRVKVLFSILNRFINDYPDTDFIIDMKSGDLKVKI
ncbi:metallophosphoesterase [uncultured Cetobacterium sp.]|uniref:metallophosphoesterase n=1 Tax=uncultured Cetobacterium sp. TaxID=527638 RepID=UPI0025F04219|nr:metallophosphoesterase [uncultured Cetobacterium sp.]